MIGSLPYVLSPGTPGRKRRIIPIIKAGIIIKLETVVTIVETDSRAEVKLEIKLIAANNTVIANVAVTIARAILPSLPKSWHRFVTKLSQILYFKKSKSKPRIDDPMINPVIAIFHHPANVATRIRPPRGPMRSIEARKKVSLEPALSQNTDIGVFASQAQCESIFPWENNLPALQCSFP